MPTLTAKNIAHLMRTHGIKSPSELSRLTRVPQPTIHRMLTGEAREPRQSTIKPITDFFGVTLAQLMETDLATGEILANVKPVASPRTVPLLSSIQAGAFTTIEEAEAGNGHERIAVRNSNPGRNAFALRVDGDSMEPRFPEGCVIVADPDIAPAAGNYVIAKDIRTEKATFKRLMQDGGRWYLRPLNPAYDTVEIDDPGMRVIAVVVEYMISGKV